VGWVGGRVEELRGRVEGGERKGIFRV